MVRGKLNRALKFRNFREAWAFMNDVAEAAEAAEADYNLTTGLLTLSGNVLLTQGVDEQRWKHDVVS